MAEPTPLSDSIPAILVRLNDELLAKYGALQQKHVEELKTIRGEYRRKFNRTFGWEARMAADLAAEQVKFEKSVRDLLGLK